MADKDIYEAYEEVVPLQALGLPLNVLQHERGALPGLVDRDPFHNLPMAQLPEDAENGEGENDSGTGGGDHGNGSDSSVMEIVSDGGDDWNRGNGGGGGGT